MKTVSVLTLSIFSIWSFGCQRNGADRNSLYFAKYISDSLKQDMDTALTFYVLIPSNQCANCIFWDSSGFVNKNLVKRVVIVSSISRDHFNGFGRYVEDKADAMLHLPFLNYNNCIVAVKNKKLLSIGNVTDLYQQIDSLDRVFNRISPGKD